MDITVTLARTLLVVLSTVVLGISGAAAQEKTSEVAESILDTKETSPISDEFQGNFEPQESDELVVERHSDGSVKIERQVSLNESGDFVNNGLFRASDERGRYQGSGQFRMGQRHGQWERVFAGKEGNVLMKNAQKGFAPPFRSIAAFNSGELDGEWTVTDAKDRVLIQWQFVRGRREGAWIWFSPDETIRRQVTYNNGRVSGNVLASDGDDKFKVLQAYLDGRALVPAVGWYGRGKKKYEGQVLKPREITEVNVDWWNGVIETKVVKTEEQEDRHGQWELWHSNGKLSRQGSYDRGEREGAFVWRHANGRKKAQGAYLDGQPDGLWQTWHPNGARNSYGTYKDGRHEGRWLTWFANGMRQSEGQYVDGVLTSQARIWAVDGRRIRPTVEQPVSIDPAPNRPEVEPKTALLPILKPVLLERR